MPIKRVPIAIEKKASSSTPVVQIIEIEGDACRRYSRAAAAKKTAESVMDELKPEIIELGLREIFRLNIKGTSPAVGADVISSVKLNDETNNTLRVSMLDKYSIKDPSPVNRAFKALKADAGDYVTSSIELKFDSDVFLNPSTGNFDERIYKRVEKAILTAVRKAEQELREEDGIDISLPSPFVPVEVFTVKPGFHKDRFVEFPTVDQQLKIQQAAPAQVNIVPLDPKKEGKKERDWNPGE